jgi:hypothetical protein
MSMAGMSHIPDSKAVEGVGGVSDSPAGVASGGRRSWVRAVGRWAPLAAAGVFLALMLTYHPFRDVFEFDMDEGNNVIKALLVDRGPELYSQVWSDQPPLFTHLLRWCFRLFGWDVNNARILVLLFASAIVFALYDSLRLTWGHRAAVAGVILLMCTKYFVTLSVSVMVGLPAIAFAMLCVWALLRWASGGGAGWLAAAGMLMSLSLATKLFTAFLLPVCAIWILLVSYRRSDRLSTFRRLVMPLAVWSVCVVVTTGAILVSAVGPSNFDQLYRTHAEARRGDSYSQGATATMLKENIRADWHVCVLAALGTVYMLLRRRYILLIAPAWWAAALAALWGHSPVWYHHHLLLTVAGCLAGGVAVGALLTGGLRPQWNLGSIAGASLRLATAIVTVTLALAVVTGAKRDKPKPWLFWGDHDRFVVELMRSYRDQTTTVVTDRQMYAFRAGYQVPANLSVTSHKRLVTSNLTTEQIAQTIGQKNPEQVVLSWRFPDSVRRRIIAEVKDRYQLVYFGVLVYLPTRQIPVQVYVRNDISGDPLAALLRAGRQVPESAQGQDFIGLVWAQRGRTGEAIASFRRAHRIDPYEPRACRHLAEAYMANGELARGFGLLQAGMNTGSRGRYLTIAGSYAWRRATCPDAVFRNGAEAEAIAGEVIQLQRQQTPASLEILAAALAAQGKFDQAGRVAQAALNLAREGPEPEAAKRIVRQLDSYRSGQAWIEPVRMPVP